MDGNWDGLRADVRRTIDELIASGRESGVQVVAYLDGEPILQVQAGCANRATGRPLAADTPIWSVSTGKALTATVAHGLRGRSGCSGSRRPGASGTRSTTTARSARPAAAAASPTRTRSWD
ncbi:serine hydrolase [Micromonospora sp. DT4]|uniref:serine hydrolase n=1 Tax=Micromonospora sp. DT4 TaxID=3393438 RepID=UPI003CF83E82